MQKRSFRSKKREGFALVLTLALISFVFMLVMALVTQVRVELSFSDARENHVLAKAHARMGMMIAIGEIQKHLGPDQRVSTTADIYDERVEISTLYENNIYPQSTALNNSVDLDEDGSAEDRIPLGQRMWTGVWKTRAGNGEKSELAYRPLPKNQDAGVGFPKSWDVDSSWDSHPAVEVAWLVSGNEGWVKKLGIHDNNHVVQDFIEVPDGIIIDDDGKRVLNDPDSIVYGKEENAWADHKAVVEQELLDYFHPLIDITAAQDESIEWTDILLAPVLNSNGDFVAEPVKVPKTKISSDQGLPIGNYAYWVGDEGVKAKLNIDPPLKTLSDRSQLAVATRPNFSVEGAYDKGSDLAKLTKLISLESFGIVDDEEDDDNVMAPYYHQFTVDSFGVLSDVRTGGLKRDLSLAFAKDDDSKLWEKDFNGNFIFRDRVHCLKSIPIYNHQSEKAFGKGLHRNHWFDQDKKSDRGPLVNDENALLAGPPWSVLAEYHKLYEKYEEEEEDNEHFTKSNEGDVLLKVVAPDEFPRVVGDNALIFDRREIEGSQGMTISEARPFFNIFGGPIRNVRPEPSNHPIFPIITKVGMAIFPAIGSDSNKLALAISPKISLWNPYDMPMKIEDLFVEIPFRSGEFSATNFNLKEYDLYRKWWIRLYKNVDSFPQKDVGNKNTRTNRAMIKSPDSPWGLFRRFVDQESLSISPDQKTKLYYKEPGIIDGSKKLYEVGGSQDLSLTNLPNGTKVLYHENPREDVTYNGEFHFFSFANDFKVNINLPRVYLSLVDDVLQPGEVATFTIADQQTESIPKDPNINPPLIRLRKGDLEDFFLWESSFAYNSEKLKSDYIVSYYINFSGIKGFGANTLERIDKTGGGFTYGQLGNYEQYDSFAMYKSDSSNFSPDSAETLMRFALNRGAQDYLKAEHVADYSNNHITEQYLRDMYANAFDNTNDLLPGIGWEWKARMPGDSWNERIVLNDFNIRAMVHSSQNGRGMLMTGWRDFHPPFLDRAEAGALAGSFSFSGVEEYTRVDEDGNALTFDLTDEIVLERFTYPSSMENLPTTKEFPWLYDFDSGWSPDAFTINSEIALNSYPSDVESYNPDTRITDLGLTPTNENPAAIVEDANDNIALLQSLIPRPINSEEKIGFFTHENDRDSKVQRSEIGSDLKSSSHAILFEIPKSAPLSVLQYRHANLNNYLHGPSYALGNSYASTQVARHRPWGRVDSRTTKVVKDDRSVPEAETWTASVQTPADMVQLQNENIAIMFAKYGDNFSPFQSTYKVVEHWEGQSIDLTDRESFFAPWRDHASNNLNHQNTTLDHSFYLNRALLDGYFLSGFNETDDITDILREDIESDDFVDEAAIWDDWDPEKVDNLWPGRRYRPFSQQHRLIGYYRHGNSWEKGLSSYSQRSDEKNGLSEKDKQSEDKEYRYQSIAGDLLIDGAFNINSTSVDAWVAQLASLRGQKVTNATESADKTPVVRFFAEPEASNNWNELRKLSDDEIVSLAKEMVKQVKIRGPFLSFSDFVNRRLNPSPMDPSPNVTKGSRPIFLQKKMSEWSKYPEDRNSVLGLRGTVQAAIANAGLNNDSSKSSWRNVQDIPEWPLKRWDGGSFFYSKFGYHAVSRNQVLYKGDKEEYQKFGSGMTYQGKNVIQVLDSPSFGTAKLFDSTIKYDSSEFGEAPENLLAVEHVATGANKPGWVMQADLLSPLAPVTSARSDTFTIRVMGENTGQFTTKSWIELVVQRTPEYVKPDLDSPHHRPHEPFKDLNFNGVWDNDSDLFEQWLDLNRNGNVVNSPDLPGVGESGRESDYRDGMMSDLKLNIDPQEEDRTLDKGRISTFGVNQRFGRKFKIVRFRWLREQDV